MGFGAGLRFFFWRALALMTLLIGLYYYSYSVGNYSGCNPESQWTKCELDSTKTKYTRSKWISTGQEVFPGAGSTDYEYRTEVCIGFLPCSYRWSGEYTKGGVKYRQIVLDKADPDVQCTDYTGADVDITSADYIKYANDPNGYVTNVIQKPTGTLSGSGTPSTPVITEPFHYRRRKEGIERDQKFQGGIAGIVLGAFLLTIVHVQDVVNIFRGTSGAYESTGIVKWIKRFLYVIGFISIVVGTHFLGLANGKKGCEPIYRDQNENIQPNIGEYPKYTNNYKGGQAGIGLGSILLILLYSLDSYNAAKKPMY